MDYRKDYYIDKISSIDIQNITPIDSLNLLNSLIDDAKKLKENSDE